MGVVSAFGSGDGPLGGLVCPNTDPKIDIVIKTRSESTRWEMGGWSMEALKLKPMP